MPEATAFFYFLFEKCGLGGVLSAIERADLMDLLRTPGPNRWC
jgi:hypothetical protein